MKDFWECRTPFVQANLYINKLYARIHSSYPWSEMKLSKERAIIKSLFSFEQILDLYLESSLALDEVSQGIARSQPLASERKFEALEILCQILDPHVDHSIRGTLYWVEKTLESKS